MIGLDLEPERRQRAQGRAGEAVVEGDGLSDEFRWHLARGRGDHHLALAFELDHEGFRRDERATALGDELEDRLEIRLAAERPRDLDGRVERLDCALELRAVRL